MSAGGRSVSSASEANGHTHQGRSPSSAATSVCSVWGILNVTPDSFSDGGAYFTPERAVERARELIAFGADVVDVGGESSRPAGKTYGAGFETVDAAEELRRVFPVVEALIQAGVVVSVDTVKAEVARAVLRSGAQVINDVSCGRSEELLEVVSEAGAELVLMHTRGRGECSGENVRYADVVAEVRDELLCALERAERYGVQRCKVWLDPGLGFAKTSLQSLAVLTQVESLIATGQRVLVGPSRKSFVAEIARNPAGDLPPPTDRLGGSAAAVTLAVLRGVHAVRVHDVKEMAQAMRVAHAARVGQP